MRTVEQSDTSLNELLDEVSKGETIEIRRGSIAIARVSPVPSHNRTPAEVADALERLAKLQERHTLGGLSIKSLIEEGRP